jgi:hypothetical protein
MKTLVVLLFITYAVVTTPQGADANIITSEMRREDPRLEKVVQFTSHEITLGSLFKELSEKSGVQISVSERGGYSGLKLSLHIPGRPICEVLNGLQSILSLRDAQWAWSRAGKSDTSYSYSFSPSRRAVQRSELLQEYAKRTAEQYASVLIRLAHMPEDRRRQNKHLITELLDLDDKEWLDELVESFLNTERKWQVLRFVKACVPEQILSKLARGETNFVMKLDDLTPAARRLFEECREFIDIKIVRPDQPLLKADGPVLLQFTVESGGSESQVAPLVYLGIEGGVGASVLGGHSLDQAIRTYVKRQWMLKTDLPSSQLGEHRVVGPIALKPMSGSYNSAIPAETQSDRPMAQSLMLRLLQAGKGANVPVIALRPRRDQRDPGDPTGKTLADIMSETSKRFPNAMYKCSNGVLLCNYAEWFLQDDYSTPLALIKQHLNRPDGLVPLNHLAALMSSLSDVQIADLAFDYEPVSNALPLRPILALTKRYPQLLGPAGARPTPEIFDAVKDFPNRFEGIDPQRAIVTSVRLLQVDVHRTNSDGIEIRLEYQIGGKWFPVVGSPQVVKTLAKP